MTGPMHTGSVLGLGFTVEVDVAGDLAFDATRADALITVDARSAEGAGRDAGVAEILIMDRSLSMADRGKIGEAKRAACAAIDALRDGTYLGIIAGNHTAETVFPDPADGGLARVDDEVRAAAKRRVNALWPAGGTAIGRWLTRAGELLESAPSGTVRHAALYTDGKNEHETPEQLDRALAACSDRFVCDARGLGDDWRYAELLRITEALHGGAEAVVAVSDLTEDFARLVRQAQRLIVPRVYLSLRLNRLFRLGFLRQTLPVEAELTGQQQREGREIHIPLGSWGSQSRQYQLSLRFDADALTVGEELRAARIELLAETSDGTRRPCAEPRAMPVRRHASLDPLPPGPEGLTRAENAHELGMAMRACANAYLNHDFAEADRELRSAIELARKLGDAERLRLLENAATVDDKGVIRLRPDVTRGLMQKVGLDSTKSSARPLEPVDAVPAPRADAGRLCGACGETTYAQVVEHCESCGRAFHDGVAGAS